mmetsp:Transcript_20693/g.52526  ORF Transcript_20693/g.52526 Transcript_20693/m.52526 type:complete len:256 (-) Transcript_20693:541-1308(-)
MQRTGRGDQRVDEVLGHGAAASEHGVRGHVHAHVAAEEQRLPREGHASLLPARRGPGAWWREAALGEHAVLEHGRAQRALHQSEPVGVGRHLVLGVDCARGVLEVDDGGQRTLETHVHQTGRVARGVAGTDHELHVQPVMGEQQRRLGTVLRRRVTHKLCRVAQARSTVPAARIVARRAACGAQLRTGCHQAGHLRPAAVREREEVVKELMHLGVNRCAARRAVASLGSGGHLGHGVGAVEGVEERAPARVGSVE